MDEEVHGFPEAWPASVTECRLWSYLALCLATWFLYKEGAWRLPEPSDLFCPEAMTTQHTRKEARPVQSPQICNSVLGLGTFDLERA